MSHSRRVFHCRSSLAAAALGFMLTASITYAQPVLVNTASDGTPGNGTPGSITALDDSGRYVVFADSSTNLVTGDGNGSVDVFVKDRISNATTRVSVASDGTERTGDSGSDRRRCERRRTDRGVHIQGRAGRRTTPTPAAIRPGRVRTSMCTTAARARPRG